MSHKYFDFSKLGGFPFNQQRLEWMQTAYSESITAIASIIGDNVIVSGCVINGNNVTDGWVIVNGELLPFVGGTNVLQSTFLVRTTATALTFKDTNQKEVQFSKFCSFGIGAGDINWGTLTRLSTLAATQKKIVDLNTTITEQAQTISDIGKRIITGAIPYDLPLNGSKGIMASMPAPAGINPSDYIGFLNIGMIDRVVSSYYSPQGNNISFYIVRESTNYGQSGDADFVLIKKQH